MSDRFLTILEVSQKQAYIFGSNKLKENIAHSAIISWVMNPEYFEESIQDPDLFMTEKNLVYSGGGHTVLEFPSLERARKFTRKMTYQIHKEYPELGVFAATVPYQENREDGTAMSPGDNMMALTKKLEQKKSIRLSAFHQGSFGIEKIDSSSFKPVLSGKKEEIEIPEAEKRVEAALKPEAYKLVSTFERLGGDKDHSNFIAVVHIDGNAMGKRLERLYTELEGADWEEYKQRIRNFSEKIDTDFKKAYHEMVACVEKNLEEKNLEELKLKGTDFPIRRIITAGDDICFVSEGRIGIECARVFLQALYEEGYAACAGVAIVHRKYPFFRAYELAEMLCSNAKAFGVTYSKDGSGSDLSCIDWHIEYGEMGDSLDQIREYYDTADGKRLELRPYIVCGEKVALSREKIRRYDYFRKLMLKLLPKKDGQQEERISVARGNIKKLRNELKKGENRAKHFIKFHHLEDLLLESYYGIFENLDVGDIFQGHEIEKPLFVKTENDEKEHSYLFDVIELIDTFCALEV